MMRLDRHPGCLRAGNLLVKWDVRLAGEEPLLDGATTVFCIVEDDTVVEREHFSGPVLRLFGRHRGLTVAWKGARMPNPAHWRPSWLLRQAGWHLAGRPSLSAAQVQACDAASDALDRVAIGLNLSDRSPRVPR